MTQEKIFAERNLADTYGRRIATRLDAGAASLPHDISERLRVARQQAVAGRRIAAFETASAVQPQAGNTLALGGGPSWWTRFASAVPLVALVAGLVAINMVQSEQRANELAEVDAALLVDDLPPAAYSDPGFAQFIRAEAESAL